jgi:DNA-binding transcriptional LysR family regulator
MDLAIVFDIDLPAGLDSVPLYSIPPYAALSAGHPLARSQAVSLAELAREPLILLDVPPAAAHTLALFDAAGVQPRIVQRTSDFELTRSLVARGLGYSLLFRRPAGDMSYEGLPLVARDPTPAVAGLGVRMIWPSATRLTDRAEAMVAFASTHARHTDPHDRTG